MKNWISEMLSEKGVPSSKRFCGLLIIIVVLCCTIGLTVNGFSAIKELLEVEFVAGCSLIGLHSITKVFSKE